MNGPQLSIFDPPRARTCDPETSHAAAARVDGFAHEHFGKILVALKQGRGTIYQIAERCGLDHVQVARRLPELAAAVPAKVRPTGEKRPSPKGGSPCRVWELT